MDSQNQMGGVGAMTLSGLTFVFNDSLMKIAMGELPPYQVLVMRGLAGIVFAAAYLAYTGEAKWRPEILSRPVLLRAILEGGAISTYIIALARAPLGDVTAIFQTTPLLVILGLMAFHGEKASVTRLGLIILGFVGALLVAQPGRGTMSPFVMMAGVSAVFAALRDLAARQVPSAVPAMVSTFVLIAVVTFISFIVSVAFETWVWPSPQMLLVPPVAGLFMMLGHHFTLLAYRWSSAQTVAPFYYCFMVFAVIAGYLLFGDVPNAIGISGMVVIVVSGLAILATERNGRADVFQSADL